LFRRKTFFGKRFTSFPVFGSIRKHGPRKIKIGQRKTQQKKAYFSTPCFTVLFSVKQSISSVAHFPHPLNLTMILQVTEEALSLSLSHLAQHRLCYRHGLLFQARVCPTLPCQGKPLPTSMILGHQGRRSCRLQARPPPRRDLRLR
jgi:hypothetical protein